MKNTLAVAVALFGAVATCSAQGAETAVAIFAGGCFWTVESDFDHAPGVVSTTSGYIGGHVDNPTYEQVVTETTGHREAVRVEYDPAVTDYATLLDTYFHLIDPIETRGQFCDFGESYTSAIYVANDEEKQLAEAEKAQVAQELGKPVATLIATATRFYPAEDYHQNFWQKDNPFPYSGRASKDHYAAYRAGCGKNRMISAIWGDQAFRGLTGHM